MLKRKYQIFFLFYLIFYFNTSFSQNESWFIALKGSFYQPIASLSDVFKSTFSGKFTFGQAISKDWEWEGKIEYFKYDKLNDDKLYFKNLNHSLEIAGAGFNLNYFLLPPESSILPKLMAGAGIYRWFYMRDRAVDSLSKELAPQFSQIDWSGGINLGCSIQFRITNHFSLLLDISYFAVIGEIWAAQAIRFENISTFQNLNLSAGIRFNL